MILLGFLLALVTVLYIPCYLRCRHLTLSGDALFDAYARAACDRQAWRLFYIEFPDGGPNHATLPDSVLAAWEPRFGRDPHFWQLRCWNAASQNLPGTVKWGWPNVDYGGSAEFLEESRRRGVANSQTLEMLAVMRRCQAYRLELGDKPLPGEANAAELREEELTLLNEAIATDPKRAWPYYRRAARLCELGRLAEAQADLMLGNVAPNTEHYDLYPQSQLATAVAERRSIANAPLCLGILQGCGGFSEDWTFKDKGLGALEQRALAAGDMQQLTAVQRAWCRMGASTDLSTYDAQAYAGRMRRLARRILMEQGDKLTRRQRYITLWVDGRTASMRQRANMDMAQQRALTSWQGVPLIHLQALLPPIASLKMTEAYMREEPYLLWASHLYLPEKYRYLELVDYASTDFGYSVLRGAKLQGGENPPDDSWRPGQVGPVQKE